jgi:probable HAF family extracellular repeat protein
LTGKSICVAAGLSFDGSVAIGDCRAGDSDREAFRWDAVNGMQGIGILAGTEQSLAGAVTPDGAVIVGESDSADYSTTKAFRWDAGNGLQDLGSLPGLPNCSASTVSEDGSIVVGTCKSSNGASAEAFRWDAASGMHDLGVPPGKTRSYGYFASGDGAVVIGDSYTSGGAEEAFRWDAAGGITGLGLLPGLDSCYLTSASGDGSIAAGICRDTSGQQQEQVFVWDAQNGIRKLQDVIESNGNDLSGWQITYPTLPSGGVAFAGTGLHMGHYEAWVAPEATASGDAVAALASLALLARRRWPPRAST